MAPGSLGRNRFRCAGWLDFVSYLQDCVAVTHAEHQGSVYKKAEKSIIKRSSEFSLDRFFFISW